MMSVRWIIDVSAETDRDIRLFLDERDDADILDLSRLVEEAVKAYLFDYAVGQAKEATAGVGECDMAKLVDDAVQWARET